MHQIGKFRVRATVANLDADICRVTVQVKLLGRWYNVARPGLVARRYSRGSGTEREAQSLYAVGMVRKVVQAGGVEVTLTSEEVRVGNGSTDYRWWAFPLAEGLTVAWMERQDGSYVLNQLL